MNPVRWFRRTRPAPAVQAPPVAEVLVASAWGLSMDDWYGLTEFGRAECRRNITVAPRFQA